MDKSTQSVTSLLWFFIGNVYEMRRWFGRFFAYQVDHQGRNSTNSRFSQEKVEHARVS